MEKLPCDIGGAIRVRQGWVVFSDPIEELSGTPEFSKNHRVEKQKLEI